MEDHGIEVALGAARELVVFLKRPGGQSQFSTVLSGQIADAGGPLGPLFAWIADNLGGDRRYDGPADRGFQGRTMNDEVDAGALRASWAGQEVMLTGTEFGLLRTLFDQR